MTVAQGIRVLAVLVSLVLAGCPPAPRRAAVRTDGRVATTGGGAAQGDFDRAFESFADAKWAEAANGFDAVVQRHPQSSLVAEARYRRGVALNRLERFDAGRVALREFLEKHPTSPYARQASVELGLAESKLGNRQDAEQILRPILGELSAAERAEVEPALREVIRSGSAVTEAIRMAANDGRSEEAARLVDAASFIDVATLYESLGEASPASGVVAAKMARIYYHLGDFERAKQAAERALAKGAGGYAAKVQESLERIALRDRVKPGTVGLILPLTGRFKSYGEAVQDGIAVAINPSRDGITLLTKDSAGDPELAVAAVEALVREGAQVIIGPVGVAEAAPAAVRAQELGVPMISLSRAEGVTGIGSFIFRNSLTNSAQGKALARYAIEVLKVKSAAILAPDITSGEEVSGAFWDALEDAGGEVRGYETYAHDQTTFSRPIKRLVARDNVQDREEFRAEANKIISAEKNPYRRRQKLEKLAGQQAPVVDFDVLLVPDYYRTVGLLAPALAVEDLITNGCDEKELERIKKTTRRDVKVVTMLGGAGWNSPDLVARGGRYVICSVFVDGFYAGSARTKTQDFVEEFEDRLQRKPGLLEAQGYDTARLVREIVQRQHPATRDAFRTAIGNVRKFAGATGDTTFGPDREADKPLFFLTINKTGIAEMVDVKLSPNGIAVPPKEP